MGSAFSFEAQAEGYDHVLIGVICFVQNTAYYDLNRRTTRLTGVHESGIELETLEMTINIPYHNLAFIFYYKQKEDSKVEQVDHQMLNNWNSLAVAHAYSGS